MPPNTIRYNLIESFVRFFFFEIIKGLITKCTEKRREYVETRAVCINIRAYEGIYENNCTNFDCN